MSCTETIFSHLYLRMARMEMDRNLKKFSSLDTKYSKNCQKFCMGMLLLVSVSTKFQFPVSYDLKNSKLP